MTSHEHVFLDDYDLLVSDRRVVIGGTRYDLAPVRSVQVESSSAYRAKALPFLLAVAFILWALSELLNAPPSYGWAGVAAVLALLCLATVRLLGGFKSHTVYLTIGDTQKAVFESRDGKAVSALVVAVRQALADRGTTGPSTWIAQPAHG